MQIHSDAFQPGDPIPRQHTDDGNDVSPPLRWEDVPAGTSELALISDDPDAPTPEPWVHWIVYQIPAEATGLAEGVQSGRCLSSPAGALQGRNSWSSGRTIGYRGPAPPPGHGVHHYRFRLYALDAPLNAKPSLDKTALRRAMRGHILAEAQIVGTYER